MIELLTSREVAAEDSKDTFDNHHPSSNSSIRTDFSQLFFLHKMESIKNLFTPSEDYNYKIIFLSYLSLSLCCLILYITAFYWKDIQGFWIVVGLL